MIDSSALVVFWKGARFVHPKSLSFRQSSCKVTKGQSQAAQPGAARTSEGRLWRVLEISTLLECKESARAHSAFPAYSKI